MHEAGKSISATESVLSYERLSYEAKRCARIMAEEMDCVRGLTEDYGGTPSWEKRTGLHTWKQKVQEPTEEERE